MSRYGAFPKVKDKDGNWVEQKARPVVDCSKDVPLTVQADRNEADINKIMARVEKGGVPSVCRKMPFFADVSAFGGLQEAIMMVDEAEESFMMLPANVRERFGNDAVQLVRFLEDPRNRKEAEELGLVEKKPAEPAGAPEAPKAQ